MNPDRPWSAVEWLDWAPDAFERARAGDKLILLSLGVRWSRGWAEMARAAFVHPAVARLVGERFVPIRVDADERPDIGDRYALGGWPTTAILSATGEILGGGTYVEGERLAQVLARIADIWLTRRDEVEARLRGAGSDEGLPEEPAGRDAAPGADAFDEMLFAAYDAAHGGFGDAPKFPHPDALRLALVRWQETGDQRFRLMASATLDALGSGCLCDPHDGGFHRCADGRDWSRPSGEKLLDVNAALIALFFEAGAALGHQPSRERARRALEFVRTQLADLGRPGFFASAFPTPGDDGHLSIDRTSYTDASAAMISSFLLASNIDGAAEAGEFAISALERLVLDTYRPGAGVGHVAGGAAALGGFLTDQVGLANALLDAYDATARTPYLMLAEELGHYVLKALADGREGGCFDRAETGAGALGLLRRRLKPFALNCAAVRVMARLARASGEPAFAEHARATLSYLAGRARAEELGAAAFALAQRELARAPAP
jgi:uncharacterized protein YyaL (SSP411 family)